MTLILLHFDPLGDERRKGDGFKKDRGEQGEDERGVSGDLRGEKCEVLGRKAPMSWWHLF